VDQADFANGEGEIELWIAGLGYIELENLSAAKSIPAGDTLHYDVKWYVRQLPDDIVPAVGSADLLMYVYDILALDSGCSSQASLSEIACKSYISPSGKVWTVSGQYLDTIPAADPECDSILTINLTITQPDTRANLSGNTIVALAEDAEYQWVDCNNGQAPISGETGKEFVPSESGDYAVIVTVNDCADTSDCVSFAPDDVIEISLQDVRLYPNPSPGPITVDLGRMHDRVTLQVKSLTGQILDRQQYASVKHIMYEFTGTKGMYFLEIITGGGPAKTFRIVKN
jgi:hypothetical protein